MKDDYQWIQWIQWMSTWTWGDKLLYIIVTRHFWSDRQRCSARIVHRLVLAKLGVCSAPTSTHMVHVSKHQTTTLLVSFDLSAAFDTRPRLTWPAPYLFGICNTVLDWFSSYLKNHTQFICLGHSCSTTASCTDGIPQGSVLEPILFYSLFTPIVKIATNNGVHQQQYTDDTKVYISISCNNTFQLDNLEDCLLFLFSWLSHNGLPLNPENWCRSLSYLSVRHIPF